MFTVEYWPRMMSSKIRNNYVCDLYMSEPHVVKVTEVYCAIYVMAGVIMIIILVVCMLASIVHSIHDLYLKLTGGSPSGP